MKFRIVEQRHCGPFFYEFASFDEMASVLMAWFTAGCSGKGASAWKLSRGKWVPVWAYQLGARA